MVFAKLGWMPAAELNSCGQRRKAQINSNSWKKSRRMVRLNDTVRRHSHITMFERCQNCKSRVLFGHRDVTGIFCSTACRDYYKHPGFCEVCLEQTIEIRTGDIGTFNGVGTSFYGRKDVCPRCGSAIRTLFGCFLFVPVVPQGEFRVKYVAPRRFISRRIRRPGEVGASLDADDEGHALLAQATKMEIDGRVRDAVLVYQHIALKYPHTSAGQDAQKSLKSLRAMIGDAHAA